MSKIVFLLSKNVVTAQSDEHIDVTDDSSGYADTKVSLWIDGSEVYWCTVTDEGGYLEYTTDFGVGDHIIEIRTTEGDSPDIHVDQMYIDDNLCMPSQYNLDTVAYGYTPCRTKYKFVNAIEQNKNSNYIWWGEVYCESTIFNTTFYRPRLVSDLGYNWRWYFTVKADGTVWWNHTPDTSDVLYDSSASYDYYLTSQWTPYVPLDMIDQFETFYVDVLNDFADLISAGETFNAVYSSADSLWYHISNDSSLASYGNPIEIGFWMGPGTYSSKIQFANSSIDETAINDGEDLMVLYSYSDYVASVVNKWYHESFTITPVQVTTS